MVEIFLSLDSKLVQVTSLTQQTTLMGHGVHCFSGGTIVVTAQELRVHWGLCMLWCKVRAGWLTGHRRPGQRAMKEGLAFWKVPEANTSVLTSVANQPPRGPQSSHLTPCSPSPEGWALLALPSFNDI